MSDCAAKWSAQSSVRKGVRWMFLTSEKLQSPNTSFVEYLPLTLRAFRTGTVRTTFQTHSYE